MNTSHFFLHLPGQKDAVLVSIPTSVTVEEALALARAAGHALPQDHEILVFQEDEEDPLGLEPGKVSTVGPRKSLVCHTCRRIAITVFYNGVYKDRQFSPNQRVGNVLHWVLQAFGITGPDATGLDLRLEGRPDEDLPENRRLGTFVDHGHCALALLLVAKPRVNG
jgi:hypothetical protein